MSGVKRYSALEPLLALRQPYASPNTVELVMASDYDHLRAANQRLEAQRDAILLQARCWAGEAKAQQSITKEVGEILGGIPSWGPIADSVAAIVADRQRLEGEVARLREALKDIRSMTDAEGPDSYRCDDREGCLDSVHSTADAALSTANGEVTE